MESKPKSLHTLFLKNNCMGVDGQPQESFLTVFNLCNLGPFQGAIIDVTLSCIRGFSSDCHLQGESATCCSRDPKHCNAQAGWALLSPHAPTEAFFMWWKWEYSAFIKPTSHPLLFPPCRWWVSRSCARAASCLTTHPSTSSTTFAQCVPISCLQHTWMSQRHIIQNLSRTEDTISTFLPLTCLFLPLYFQPCECQESLATHFSRLGIWVTPSYFLLPYNHYESSPHPAHSFSLRS